MLPGRDLDHQGQRTKHSGKGKKAKKELRQQIRKENYLHKERFYTKLMSNPDSKSFHRLIRMNQTNRNITTCFIVNVTNILDTVRQRNSLKNYFEDLAVPKQHEHLENDYLELCELSVSLIRKLQAVKNDSTTPFMEDEVASCIKNLNTGKSSDEFGLCAEQLKAAGDVILPILRDIYNEILKTGTVPDCFKDGILTPVPKSGKDVKFMDSYRGITVTSIIGKLFEELLLLRLLEHVNVNQSDCQFGFTKNLNPLMSSVICSEAIVEAKMSGKPLYLVTIDTEKAFN